MYYNSSSMIYYLILVLPAFLLSIYAQIRVKSAYSKMSRVRTISGLTGAQAAEAVLRYYHVTGVRIEKVAGKLSDHFDPRTNVIRLSEGVYDSNSIAAIGIASHEAGHAAQHAENYMPIKVRNSIIPVCNIGTWVGIPLAFVGFYLSFTPLVWVGLALYSFIAVFQLVTLPVELNASSRALTVIEETGLLRGIDENKGAKKVLNAAALTYIAALAVTLGNLLYYIIRFTGRRR